MEEHKRVLVYTDTALMSGWKEAGKRLGIDRRLAYRRLAYRRLEYDDTEKAESQHHLSRETQPQCALGSHNISYMV
jgi:hypothetical protein